MQQLNVKSDKSYLTVKLLDFLNEKVFDEHGEKPEYQQILRNLIGILTSDEKRRQQRVEKQEETVALLASKAKVQGKSERSNMHGKNHQS